MYENRMDALESDVAKLRQEASVQRDLAESRLIELLSFRRERLEVASELGSVRK